MHILVSALGAQPDIIAETVGLFNYAPTADFYAASRLLQQITAARQGLSRVDELWLVATDQPHQEISMADGYTRIINSTEENFACIKQQCGAYGVQCRLFLLQDVPDIKSNDDARAFHDLALRVVAAAKRRANGGKLYLSLACGRKTMSADMQDAAWCFGCDMLLHILGDSKAEALPVLLGAVAANPALQNLRDQVPEFDSAAFLPCPPQTSFLDQIQEQKKQSQHFFTTYYLEEEESRANFHILYTLPPDKIKVLRDEKIGVDPARRPAELEWLRQLPKADLHCHLGGVLDPEDMIAVAECYAEDLEQAARANPDFARWRATLSPFQVLPSGGWKRWRKHQADELHVPASLIAPALLLTYPNADALSASIFGDYQDEHRFRKIGLSAYEGLGDLQGSALLCQEKALRETLHCFLHRCEQENVFYLELRCSPLNYANHTFPAQQVLANILAELEGCSELETSLLLIATRHGGKEEMFRKIRESVSLVQACQQDARFQKYFRGFDLAGDEDAASSEDMRREFLEIMQDCYNITIHAGEIMPCESIWQAVYHLNAERIGHGLTLRDRPDLMNKFLERGIGIEMCPSSNDQIVGFQDNYLPDAGLQEYPLKKYLDAELLVSVNTDDPGISRTSATQELHKAARLTKGGLSKWEILQLLCNAFRTAFYPYQRKKALMRRVEKRLGDLIGEDAL